MNSMRAGGFLVVGAVLGFLPHVAPGWCLANGAGGSSARGLWLGLMSALQVGIAVSYFLRAAAGVLTAAMRDAPARRVDGGERFERKPVGPWIPAVVPVRRTGPGRARWRTRLAERTAFKSGLVEPRRLA